MSQQYPIQVDNPQIQCYTPAYNI